MADQLADAQAQRLSGLALVGPSGGESASAAAALRSRVEALAAQNSCLKATAAMLSRALITVVKRAGTGAAPRSGGGGGAGDAPSPGGDMGSVLRELAAVESILGGVL